MNSLICRIQKENLIPKEIRFVVTRDRVCVVGQLVQTSIYKINKYWGSGGVMYNIISIVNSAVWYI